MIAISLSKVTLVLGARALFRDLSWEIQYDQKIGLIGPNGAGKSSLLKLIIGEHTPEPGGAVTRARGVTVGYLPQQPELDTDLTALEAALRGNPRVAQVQAEIEQVETSLGDPAVFNNARVLERALAAQQALLEEFAALGGESYPQRVRELLLGLGLPASDLDTPLGLLSGGQKKLVGLARLLLLRPSVLLLDEPDNHLDLPGKVYLEQMIRDYPGAVVIVSHDRYLLDSAIGHIAEIEDGRLAVFSGDYTSYMLDKEERLARQEELYKVQQREITRLEASIKRLALWGRIYDNEKFTSRAKAMQNRLDRMDKLDRPVIERRRMDLQLEGWRGSNKVLELRGVQKSFAARNTAATYNLPAENNTAKNSDLVGPAGLRQILGDPVDQVLRHGERVGLIGPNGSGKSVLLRMILGQEPPSKGEIILGPSVKTGYYAQEHETLDFDQTLLEAVRYAGNLSESSAVAFLIRYLFTYRQATQKIGDLSGGERSRLQLALLVLSGANFLLLDEPTNNLDIASAEVLETALGEFIGTVLVISHDRYFLDRTVDRLLVFEDGRLADYPGGYSDYLASRNEINVS